MKTDLELQKDVQDELKWEPILRNAEIGVTAKGGIITLTGFVDSYSKKGAAERAAERVFGVRAVAQEIEVKLLSAGNRSDHDIANAILEAFKWNTDVPEDRLKVAVENGWVKIEGDVDWQFQKDAAEECVENLTGVKLVSNLVTIKPKVNTKIVKDNIVKALHRNVFVEANNINVETIGNKVVLKGKVHSRIEKSEVEKAAWSAPGVTNVEDDLVVTM